MAKYKRFRVDAGFTVKAYLKEVWDHENIEEITDYEWLEIEKGAKERYYFDTALIRARSIHLEVCWLCNESYEIWDSGLCFNCWGWADDEIREGRMRMEANEEEVKAHRSNTMSKYSVGWRRQDGSFNSVISIGACTVQDARKEAERQLNRSGRIPYYVEWMKRGSQVRRAS